MIAIIRTWHLRRTGGRLAALIVVQLCACLMPAAAMAAEHYALIVTGASGGPVYAEKYDAWRTSLVETLRSGLGYTDDRLFVLSEKSDDSARQSTAANVRRVLTELRTRLERDDQLLVVLIGHGTTSEDGDAKFNLVGPDLSSTEWAALLKPIAAGLVFVDTTSASFPFLRALAARGRLVITANDSSAQQFETVFPEFFVSAFVDPAADADKNGKVSLWEAFAYASAGVRRWFEQHDQLATERALIDDTGAGVGRESQNPGDDGYIARGIYLAADAPAVASSNPALAALLARRSGLAAALQQLQARRATTAPEDYARELEQLLVEMAKVAGEIRAQPR